MDVMEENVLEGSMKECNEAVVKRIKNRYMYKYSRQVGGEKEIETCRKRL